MTIKSKVAGGLVALVLAGTLLTSTSCTLVKYNFHFVQEQTPPKKETVSRKNLAVLLIDMQDYFIKELSEEEKKREIPYQLDVLDYCKTNNIPVFVLEYSGCGETTNVLKEKVDSLPIKEYVAKTYDNGFIETSLEYKLKERSIEAVILMGVNASACVRLTAEGALNAGFKIMTSKDLIADCDWHVSGEYIIKPDGSRGTSDESVPWYKEHGIS